MSLPSTSRARKFDEEENDRRDRLEIQEADRSPALSIQDEEDEADDGDDHRALLSSTIVRRGENGLPNNQHERSKLRNASHVSNWRFMKDIFVETMPTLMFALLGTFLTGELLELLATWQAFKNINELLILVPMLLNLKGNLEMNLSARLSTASNMGDLDTREVRRSLISGNLSLLQVQALLVSCLAAALSSLIGMILPSESESPKTPASGTMASLAEGALRLAIRAHPHRPPSTLPTPANSGPREFMIILLVAQTAASLSSIILGAFMCSVVLLCRYFKLNPDNIAPATASALGDLLTLSLLGISSHFLYPLPMIGLLAIQLGFIAILIFSFYLTVKNHRVKGLLKEGWTPLIVAMVISSGTGMFLDAFVGRYKDYGLVSIAQDGIPGSVGSVYISRLSTALHEGSSFDEHQEGDGHDHHSEVHSKRPFFKTNPFSPKNQSTAASVVEARPKVSGSALLLVTVPVLVLFLAVSYATKWLQLPAVWACGFVVFFECTVVASLLVSHYLTLLLWNRDYDPDTYAMPLQSSLVDVIGQTFLVTCYEVVGLLAGRKILQGRRAT